MSHGFENNVAVLRRWAAHADGSLPTDWHSFYRDNMVEASQIAQRDPELVQLLSGKASAGLRADALSGKFSAVPPDYEQQQRQAQYEQKVALLKKFEEGEATLTDKLRLAELAPEEHAKWEAKKAPSEEQVFRLRQQQAAQQQEALLESRNRMMASNRAAHRASGGGW